MKNLRLKAARAAMDLSQEALALPEHQFNLGCACLSMTCFELTQAETVTAFAI